MERAVLPPCASGHGLGRRLGLRTSDSLSLLSGCKTSTLWYTRAKQKGFHDRIAPLQRAHALSAVHGGVLLEFWRVLQADGRPAAGCSPRPDHRCGDVAGELDGAAHRLQHASLRGRRSRLGRRRLHRRHAAAAGRYAASDRQVPRIGQAGGGRRSRSDVEPACLRQRGFSGARRGRECHRRVHRGLGQRRALRRLHRAEIPGRRHQDAGAALRPAQIRGLSLSRCAVFARLSVHLRVLRHHRALRPRAADQDDRADVRRARAALPDGLSRPSRLRRRQFHRQQEVAAAVPAPARRMAARARLSLRAVDRGLGQSRRRSRTARR